MTETTGVQVHAHVAARMLVDIQRAMQAGAAVHLKAVVRELPRAVPNTPDKDGYIRKRSKRGGRTAKAMSCTVLAGGLEIWMVDGAGIADLIHEKDTPTSERVLPKIIERWQPKADAAVTAQLKNMPGEMDLGALAHATAARSGEFLEDAGARQVPPAPWEALIRPRGKKKPTT